MTRIGLVLGAGGVAGQAFHAGVLSAIAEATDWDPRSAEIIIGTSAGSITAALLRAGVAAGDLTKGSFRRAQQGPGTPEPVEQAAAVGGAASAVAAAATGLVTPLTLRRRHGRARLGGRIASVMPPGQLSPGGIIRMVREAAGDDWPDRETWICAVHRASGRRYVFGHDGLERPPLSKAVAASCAIPGYFQPVVIGRSDYVDGGAHSPTNLDLLAGLGLDAVVVTSPMSTGDATAARVDLPARLMFRAALARETFAVRRRGTPVVSIQPSAADLDVMGFNAMDPSRWHDVVRQARESTLLQLQHSALGRLVAG